MRKQYGWGVRGWGASQNNPQKALIKSASLYLSADKADGVSPGINSPLTNPWKDLKGTADCTLVDFAGTSADGWTVQTIPHPNGRESALFNQAVVNGDFSNGTTGWANYAGGVATASNKVLSITGNGTFAIPGIRHLTNVDSILNGKHYIRAKVKVTNSLCTFIRLRLQSSASIGEITISNPVINTDYVIQGVFTVASQTGKLQIELIHGYADNATANGKVMQVDGNAGVFAIPMTGTPYENFTADQMNALVNSTTYWEGDKTLRWNNLTFLNLDGLNSFGQFANIPSIDIVGTGAFALGGFVNLTTQKFQYLYSVGDPNVVASPFFGLQLLNDGSVRFRNGTINGITILPGSTLQNGVLVGLLVYRKNGRLKLRFNKTEAYNQPNTDNLQTSNFKRFGSRIANADGTSHGDFLNGRVGDWFIINNDFDEEKLIKNWDKVCASKYGL
jgi:hypothetical protein